MIDENTDEEVVCPTCGEPYECPHLVAAIDLTHGGVEAGYADERDWGLYEPLTAHVQAHVAHGRPLPACPGSQAGRDFVNAVDTGEDFEYLAVAGTTRVQLLCEILDAAGAKSRSAAATSFPTSTPAYETLDASNPGAVFSAALTRVG